MLIDSTKSIRYKNENENGSENDIENENEKWMMLYQNGTHLKTVGLELCRVTSDSTHEQRKWVNIIPTWT